MRKMIKKVCIAAMVIVGILSVENKSVYASGSVKAWDEISFEEASVLDVKLVDIVSDEVYADSCYYVYKIKNTGNHPVMNVCLICDFYSDGKVTTQYSSPNECMINIGKTAYNVFYMAWKDDVILRGYSYAMDGEEYEVDILNETVAYGSRSETTVTNGYQYNQTMYDAADSCDLLYEERERLDFEIVSIQSTENWFEASIKIENTGDIPIHYFGYKLVFFDEDNNVLNTVTRMEYDGLGYDPYVDKVTLKDCNIPYQNEKVTSVGLISYEYIMDWEDESGFSMYQIDVVRELSLGLAERMEY